MWIRASAVRATLLAVVIASPVWAFKPNEEGHLGITTEALQPIQRIIGGQTFQFSEHALREIRDANRNVDIITFTGVEEHFDDESFTLATQRLINLKQDVITQITADPPDGQGARTDLGGALHTLQDFYSHSNWVELGNAEPDGRLGISTFQSLPGDAHCPTDPGTLDLEVRSTTTGYFPFPDPCATGTGGTPFGKCRHGVEFICEDGINKDAPGRENYGEARTLAVTATENFVNEILETPGVKDNPAAIGALMDGAGTQGSTGSILLMASSLENEPKIIPVPVDSTIEKVTFVLTMGSGNRVDVVRPSGAVVAAGNPDVTMQTAGTNRTIAVDDPEDGSWQVRVSGKGRFALDAQAESPLQLDRFDLVTLTGRIAHFGYKPLTGEPKAQSRQVGLADLIGFYGSPSFSLVSDQGNKIQSTSLFQGVDADAAASEYLGLITMPKNAFRMAVTGTDPSGLPYQRMAPRLYKPTK